MSREQCGLELFVRVNATDLSQPKLSTRWKAFVASLLQVRPLFRPVRRPYKCARRIRLNIL